MSAPCQSIQQFGLKVPLVLSEDNYLLSGHRRLCASRLAGLEEVPCQFEPIRHWLRGQRKGPDKYHVTVNPEFVRLLMEYNRQRVKSLDEQLREAIVEADPAEAYQSLIEHRRQRSADALAADTLVIPEGKALRKSPRPSCRSGGGAADTPGPARILAAVRAAIHYPLLNCPPLIHASKPDSRYTNSKDSYKALDELLTRARIFGAIPMNCIDDETRPVETWDVAS